VGFITGILGVVTFARAKTTVNPTKPQSSSSLVSWGVYRVTRNPMYLGGLFILTGWAMFLSTPVVFLFLPGYILYINRFQIVPEERVLTSLFGAEFIAYKSRARRWL
jgi:protein-S-isoprenylcysteine O-methyltransferase Ste14